MKTMKIEEKRQFIRLALWMGDMCWMTEYSDDGYLEDGIYPADG